MQIGQNYSHPSMDIKEAESIAIKILTYLTHDAEQLGHFLSLSGLGPESIRAAANHPEFLVGILEYAMGNEEFLLNFIETRGLRPTMIAAAHFIISQNIENS